MRSFRELLQQVEECHDAEVARLRDYCAELEQNMDANPSNRRRRGSPGHLFAGEYGPMGNAQGTSPPFREEPKEAVHAETSAPSQAELPEPVPFQCTFGEEVQQLGFRINWSGERPSIESIQEGAAYQRCGAANYPKMCGIRETDTILAINGTDTQHQTRDDLLPLLRERPLQLSMTRTSNTQEAPLSWTFVRFAESHGLKYRHQHTRRRNDSNLRDFGQHGRRSRGKSRHSSATLGPKSKAVTCHLAVGTAGNSTTRCAVPDLYDQAAYLETIQLPRCCRRGRYVCVYLQGNVVPSTTASTVSVAWVFLVIELVLGHRTAALPTPVASLSPA
eukprot:s6698_g2.t1